MKKEMKVKLWLVIILLNCYMLCEIWGEGPLYSAYEKANLYVFNKGFEDGFRDNPLTSKPVQSEALEEKLRQLDQQLDDLRILGKILASCLLVMYSAILILLERRCEI